LRAAIATSRLRPGDQLPTVRQLAVELRINANTVARVYADVNAQRPKEYWDYEALSIDWGYGRSDAELIRSISLQIRCYLGFAL
jgi:DNA-binding transcriptional MocR family regulator